MIPIIIFTVVVFIGIVIVITIEKCLTHKVKVIEVVEYTTETIRIDPSILIIVERRAIDELVTSIDVQVKTMYEEDVDKTISILLEIAPELKVTREQFINKTFVEEGHYGEYALTFLLYFSDAAIDLDMVGVTFER